MATLKSRSLGIKSVTAGRVAPLAALIPMALLKIPNYLWLGTKGGAHPYNLTLLKNYGLHASNKSTTNDYCIVDGNHRIWQTDRKQTGLSIKKFITQMGNN